MRRRCVRRDCRPSSAVSTRSCSRRSSWSGGDDPDVKALLSAETKLFDVRVNGRAGQKAQLRERIQQLNEEIEGLSAQERAKDQEIALVQKELTGVRELY